ncbi:LysM peptidoglycan-binding domain-containing protein [Thermodesulfobacteriota bacterium]
MIKGFRIIVLILLVSGGLVWLQQTVQAFEIFPRPLGQYTVRRGDTLYGIAGTYYTNPELWPFLLNQNPFVEMPRSVDYPENEELTPGTKLNVFNIPFPYTAMNQDYNAPTGLPLETRFLIRSTPYKGVPYGKQYFKYRLNNRPLRVYGYLVASPEVDKQHFLERDLVYIRFRPSKRQSVLVGDRFGIYRERGPISHPVNPDTNIGFVAEIVGEVEIVSTNHKLATAMILESYVEIKRGDKICLFTPRQKEIVPSKTHKMLVGTILTSVTRHTKYRDVHNLENDIVFLDRGKCDGLRDGMLFNIYRPTRPVPDPYFYRFISTPDKYLGEGMILKAFDKRATMIITRSREEVLPGDIVKSVSD